MATVSFHLKEPGVDRPTAIYALLTIDRRNRVKVYTGQSIHPSKWLKAEQRAQVRGRGNELNGHLNDALAGISERLLLAYAEHLTAGTVPTAAAMREAAAPERLDEPAPAAVPAGALLWQHFEEWVAYTRAAGTVRTAQAHATAGRHLREFSEAQGMAIDFETLTPTVGDRWAAHLLNVAKLTDNTINKHLGRLKAFMKWAAKRATPTARRWTA